MNTIYTLKDIHDFLLQKGYPEWTYEVYDRHLGNKKEAKIADFLDECGFFDHAYMTFYDKQGNEDCLEVQITDFSFTTFKDDSNVMGSGSTTSVDKNFTNDWINFLFATYEEEYAKPLLRHALNEKRRIKEEAEDKIEKFRWKIHNEAKGPYMHYRDLELKAKSILSVGEIVEIEHPNNSSCDESCLGVRYYDSTTMTIRNTGQKDEKDILGE